tara:strand:+ start:5897 stop:6037 length:141 start_codon:yes stop_codon:yes gene_type:complete
MKLITGFLVAAFAVVLGLSALFNVKSLPIWIFIIAMILFSGSKRKK